MRTNTSSNVTCLMLPLALGVGACGGSYADHRDSWGYYSPSAPQDDGGEDASTSETEPEDEEDSLRFNPATTPKYIFVANPDRDTLTRIAVPSLSVLTAAVDAMPLQVATTPDGAYALTLNVSASTLSRVEAETMAVTTIGVRPHLNRMDVSDDGEWVFCWFDPDAEGADIAEGVQSYTEASLIHIPTAASTALTVGKAPQGVSWTVGGALAVVLSEAELTVLTLGPSPTSTWYALEPDDLSPPTAEELVLSPDGAYAFVRRFGDVGLLHVRLADGEVSELGLGANPTDMDVSPDGDALMVVARDEQLLFTIDFADPTAIPATVALPERFGSLTFADEIGVLYTNASRLPRIAFWDPADNDIVQRELVKPVQTVGVSADGASLLIFHTEDDASDADRDSPFYGEWAMTAYDLVGQRQSPLLLSAEPAEYAISDGGWGFFSLTDLPFLEAINLDTLLYEEIALKSNPVHVGVLPGTDIGYASQEHDLGRISFYDADSGEIDTVTGFELNAAIEVSE